MEGKLIPYNEKALPRYAKKRLSGIARPLGNRHGWTNGYLLDLVKVPDWVSFIGVAVDPTPYVENGALAQIHVTPEALLDAENRQIVALVSRYNKTVVFVNALYWKYFLVEHEDVSAWIVPNDERKIVYVKSSNNLVGVIAPFMPDVTDDLIEAIIRMTTNTPFVVGDRVKTSYFPDEANIVRKVTHVVPSTSCQSGWLVSADGGEPCPCCGRAGTSTPMADSTWFEKLD